MSTVTPTQPSFSPPPPLASPAVRRITVREYERMAGALDDDRVELIDGYLVTKMGKKPPHVWAVDSVEELLRGLMGAAWCLRRESPVRIPDFDEPEPDVAIARGTRATYRTRHPDPADIALIVEVSETTYDRDRGEKWAAYAKGAIPIYWIINLVQKRIEVYTDPGPAGYQTRQDYHAGEVVPLVIGGQQLRSIAVDDILT
jgi:Uma2 family endonuclease